jgi:DNA-directed RNA polymerase specialized sigma24 family protein
MPSTKIVTCPAGCPHAARPRGSPPSEVCELLGLTEANQRVPLHRARSRVRAALLPLMEVSR